ncbi:MULTISPECIES: PDDEXK nuclease domain-containing protein [Sphingobacterium]|uniref:PDDEXK nuclease domain-containing protein n=1 Tax=Sphingobacterium TaxID=28453 RepID=UPI00104D8CA7|nr:MULTISPECIES: PDDEXK nuclease domain-containing protein [Sphingobacterium]MCW2259699.1 putative nuclease of restriction endonuclease-like (RecB) superfamily [Sphingobacterium kitahiroshimense]TCR03459.1 putative nuclease of restriction endonuclease-like (RecB) superfamily [Sphingobacterium sp. JUb78]
MLVNQTIITDIKTIIAQSKDKAIRAVDHQRTLMYWHIGKRIFEEEQDGKERADYGTYLIKYLSEKLQPEFGTGFSIRQINLYRQLYRTFPIVHALRAQLSWTQYKLLLGVDSEEKREFYIAETIKNNWTSRQLERQVYSNLYERLLLSNDKDSVLAVAKNEKLPSDAKEIIKDPMFLEFLGLKRETSYYERDLENAIITHLQEFLLELGNGFSFVSRQKRIHLDGDEFLVDLVFYNRLLQCFVIIEIKTHKLTHQDIGQLQMYVNYYDRIEKLSHENPTIGILLCAHKNDTVVKFTLPEEQRQIIASQYKLYLPTEKQLLEEVKKELDSFEEKENI